MPSSLVLRSRGPVSCGFWGRQGRGLECPPPSASDAPASSLPVAAAAVAVTAPAAVAEIGPAHPPATIVIDGSPPGFAPRAEGWDRPTEVAEESQAEKRPRVEVSPGPSSPPPTEETVPSPPLVPGRPNIEGALGRPLAVTDRTGGNPKVVAVLGRACALPLDMAKWATMDNESLLLSSMRSLIAVSF